MDKKNLVKCVHLFVACKKNDPVCIRCGEPEFIGFNFYVKKGKAKKMKKYIEETLKDYDIPLIKIQCCGVHLVDENKVSTKKEIHKKIRFESRFY